MAVSLGKKLVNSIIEQLQGDGKARNSVMEKCLGNKCVVSDTNGYFLQEKKYLMLLLSSFKEMENWEQDKK